MTPALLSALKALQVVRTGHVLRNADGTPVSDSQARDAMYRICVSPASPSVAGTCYGTASERTLRCWA